MILIYTSFGCTSATKAKQWLDQNHLPYVEKNIQNTLLNKDEIKYLLQRCPNGTEDIISTRSKAFKNLKSSLDDLSMNDLVTLIQNHPTILKRPIIVNQENFVVGYDDDEITSFIPANLREYAFKTAVKKIVNIMLNVIAVKKKEFCNNFKMIALFNNNSKLMK